MSYKRSVWVLDIHEYLDVINQALDQMVTRYPWLDESRQQPIIDQWNWMNVNQVNHREERDLGKTQRDLFVDWIVRQELDELFYLFPIGHTKHPGPDLLAIYNELVSHYGIRMMSSSHLLIPTFYGDISSIYVFRTDCWLYIESEAPSEVYHNALRTTTRTRY